MVRYKFDWRRPSWRTDPRIPKPEREQPEREATKWKAMRDHARADRAPPRMSKRMSKGGRTEVRSDVTRVAAATVMDERQGMESLADVLRGEPSKVRAVLFVPEYGKKKLFISKELAKKVRSKFFWKQGFAGLRYRTVRIEHDGQGLAHTLHATYEHAIGGVTEHRDPTTLSNDSLIESFLAALPSDAMF
jgi:hypothetical protein